MIIVLTGSDIHSRTQKLAELTANHEVRLVSSISDLPAAVDLSAPSLFSEPSLYICENLLTKIPDELWSAYLEVTAPILCIEDALDLRSGRAKGLSANSQVQLLKFDQPEGVARQNWLKTQAQSIGLELSASQIQLILSQLDPEPDGFVPGHSSIFQTSLAAQALQKLKDFQTGGGQLTAENIQFLLPLPPVTHTWPIISAVMDKNIARALTLLNQRFAHVPEGDQKGELIPLVAGLSEQIRLLILALSAYLDHVPDDAVVAKTGWKPARLRNLQRQAQKYKLDVLQKTMVQLAALDLELKTGSLPGLPTLALILAQLA